MKKRIYLDNNSTTFIDPRVANAIFQCLELQAGNPSSLHSFGREARALLQNARRDIAEYLNVKPQEMIFTSGGTEGLNMAIKGLLELSPGGHVITSNVEHSCVYATLQRLQSAGWDVDFLSPGAWGAIKADQVRGALRPDTRLITLMAVNNETGVKTDINAIAALAEEANIPFIVDGVSLLGKEEFTIHSGVSAMCFSGHKLHAPTGIGVSFVRQSLKLAPLLTGGDQEFQRRGGTENLPGIVGLAEAVRLLKEELPGAVERMRRLRDKLESQLLKELEGAFVSGEGPRVGNTSNMTFPGVDGEALLAALDMEGIAVSHGSACSSGALEPSRVLLNMGLPRQQARASLRMSLSRFTTEEEVDAAIPLIVASVKRLTRH